MADPSTNVGGLDQPSQDEQPYGPGDSRHFIAADRELHLTEPERNLYLRHLMNLWEGKDYLHPDGSRSTLYSSTVERDGRTYVIPSVYGGAVLDQDAAVNLADAAGLDQFPAYSSEEEAQARYQRMHQFMDRDVEDWGRSHSLGGPGRATREDAAAISRIESGGRYDAVGPQTDHGRAYGRYQVMEYNIPAWTKEILGRSMTPQEFLHSRAAQDEVFAVKFGQYKDLYGDEGAARAWFGGPGHARAGGSDRDVLGTSVEDYGKRYVGAINSR